VLGSKVFRIAERELDFVAWLRLRRRIWEGKHVAMEDDVDIKHH
jgi:hypothetical protein